MLNAKIDMAKGKKYLIEIKEGADGSIQISVWDGEVPISLDALPQNILDELFAGTKGAKKQKLDKWKQVVMASKPKPTPAKQAKPSKSGRSN